jgi:cystathionine beta-lyase
MTIDFDTKWDHRGLNSLKWEFFVRDGEPEPWEDTSPDLGDARVLSMWVADMDFRVAEPIVAALQRRVQSGIFGYAGVTSGYISAVTSWMQRRHGCPLNHEWVVATIGLVPALHMIVRQFTGPGDSVLIQRPVYYPFSYAVENNQRKVISNSLCLENGEYRMDFDDLEAKVRDANIKLAILCNPHNPVGRVWSRGELSKFARICHRNKILVVSDEIHGDLILPGHKMTSYCALDPELTENSIVCTSASKTFNLAGLKTSNLIIKNSDIRAKMKAEIHVSGLWGLNPFGLVATQTAYESGESWLKEVIRYIADNHELLDSYLRMYIPVLSVAPAEATYLAWVDCRGLGLDESALNDLMMGNARVYLNNGSIFGPEGSGFVRINLACPSSILKEALGRIRTAVNELLT